MMCASIVDMARLSQDVLNEHSVFIDIYIFVWIDVDLLIVQLNI